MHTVADMNYLFTTIITKEFPITEMYNVQKLKNRHLITDTAPFPAIICFYKTIRSFVHGFSEFIVRHFTFTI